MNRFDPIEHKYYIDNEEVPSITQVLKEIGAVNDFWFDNAGKERGTSVHAVCNKILRREPFEPNPEHAGYYAAFEKFLSENIILWLVDLCEKPLFSRTHLLGGTPDLVGNGYDRNIIMDIKTGTPGYATKLQTAAQAILLYDNKIAHDLYSKRFSLQLNKSGTYKLEEYNNSSDMGLFLGALDLIHDRRKYEMERKHGTSKTQESS